MGALATTSRRAGRRSWALKGSIAAEHSLRKALKNITGVEVKELRWKTTTKHPFTRFLEERTDNLPMLAALRRGLGREPGAVPAMYRCIAPFLNTGREADLFMIASLFALHPVSDSEGNMGHHMRALSSTRSKNATENHLQHLLESRRDTLEAPLQRAISILKSHGIPVNWHQLMSDLPHWDHPKRFVQFNWGRAFWPPTQGESR